MCAVCDCVKCVFPDGVLFVLDILAYFCVECLYACQDIRSGVLAVKDIARAYFLFYVGAEGRVVVSDSAVRDVLFAAVSDYCVEVFDGKINVVVICNVVVL